MAGRKPKEFSEKERELAVNLTLAGIDQEQIARILKCSKNTLTKHMKEEIDDALAQRHAGVAGSLMTSIKDGNVAAQIFYLKTQCRWKDNSTNEGGDPESKVVVPNLSISLKGLKPVDGD